MLPIDLLQLVLDKLVQKGEPFSADVDTTLEDLETADLQQFGIVKCWRKCWANERLHCSKSDIVGL